MNEWICEIIVIFILFIFIYINYEMNIMNKVVYFLILDSISFFSIIIIGIILKACHIDFIINNLIIAIIYNFLQILFFILLGKIFSKSFKSLDNKSIKIIFRTLLIPSIIMSILFELYFVIEDQFWFNIILVLYVISFIVLIMTTIQLVKMIQSETRNKFIEKMLIQTHKQMQEINEYHKEVRKIKHDHKNHLIVMKNLLNHNKYNELENYIFDLNALADNMETPIISGNIFLDAILNHKKEEHKNINFIYQVRCSSKLFIDEINLCSLVFNLLDNAIEELQRNKKLDKCIKFTLKEADNEIFIKMVNPLTNSKDLKSEKKDHTSHGLGMEIIKRIVDKYDGEMLITQDENFIIEIMLNKK